MKHKEMKKKKGFKDYFRLLLLTICVAVFVYSGYQLLNIYLQYRNIDKAYDALLEEYVEDNDGFHIIAWDDLLERNPDVIAWIQIPNTNIDYPVLQGDTNDTYLRHDIDGNYLVAGSIFVDANHSAPLEEPNTIIYGHNMRNSSMFSDLKEYINPEFVKDHPYVYIYLPDGTVSEYQIVSSQEIDAYSDIYMVNLPNLDTHYTKIMDGNKLDVPFEKDQSPMITLSTCATYDVDNTARVVVHAALQRSGINPAMEQMR